MRIAGLKWESLKMQLGMFLRTITCIIAKKLNIYEYRNEIGVEVAMINCIVILVLKSTLHKRSASRHKIKYVYLQDGGIYYVPFLGHIKYLQKLYL